MQRTVQSFYRCKVKDKVLYQQMRDAYEPFTNEERLRESLHSYSTQKNEAMNNSVAKYAPKTRTYSTTMALTNRVMIAIGTSNLGYVTFWERVFFRSCSYNEHRHQILPIWKGPKSYLSKEVQ